MGDTHTTQLRYHSGPVEMNRRQQLSILLALPALAATTLTSPAATAARSSRGGSHVGLLRNCSGQTVKVVVGSKVLTLLGPGAVKFKEIPSGRHTVLIVGRRSTKVLFRARIGVYGPGWRVRYMCSRKQKQRFRGSIRNCSRRTVKVYLDGRLKLTVPPRSVRRRKISGTHQVRLVPDADVPPEQLVHEFANFALSRAARNR